MDWSPTFHGVLCPCVSRCLGIGRPTWSGPVVTQSGTQIVLRTWQAWASAGFILLPCRTRLACIRHIADQDETVAELASLPIGHIAERDDVGSPWHIGVHKSPDE